MVSGLDLYIDHLDGLIRKLSPAQRRGLMKDIAVSLRHNNKLPTLSAKHIWGNHFLPHQPQRSSRK